MFLCSILRRWTLNNYLWQSGACLMVSHLLIKNESANIDILVLTQYSCSLWSVLQLTLTIIRTRVLQVWQKHFLPLGVLVHLIWLETKYMHFSATKQLWNNRGQTTELLGPLKNVYVQNEQRRHIPHISWPKRPIFAWTHIKCGEREESFCYTNCGSLIKWLFITKKKR